MKLSFLNVDTTDPAFNLALEEYVFEFLPRDRSYFMLWQNDNAVIVGRYQNTLAEVNESFARANDIRIVRRLSGGGAVYHDKGNLNYTFITDTTPTAAIDFNLFCYPIIQALNKLGIQAVLSGRNDMTVDGKKFSGNAQYTRNGRVMHHGTIMFDSNLDIMEQALSVDPLKIHAKGVRSVRSRVTNLREHLPDSCQMRIGEFRAFLCEHVLAAYQNAELLTLQKRDFERIVEIKRSRYDTWDWNYGNSPMCTLLRKSYIEGCGTIEAHIFLAQGVISKVNFYGDYFSVKSPEQISTFLVGRRPEESAYMDALENIDISQYFNGITKTQFIDLLLAQDE